MTWQVSREEQPIAWWVTRYVLIAIRAGEHSLGSLSAPAPGW